MRISLSRGTVVLGAVLLGTMLFAGTAGARRPVGAPAQPPPKPPPAPVVQPAPAPAAAAPAAAPAAGPAAAAGAKAEQQKPAEPPKPVEFKDAAAVAASAGKKAEAKPIGPHTELRATKRVGDLVYVMSVRPGEPKASTPVEVQFRLNEMLSIPDPNFGDRKPVEKAKLLASISGPGVPERLFEVHPLASPGAYGVHFTPPANTGVYRIALQRTDGRNSSKVEFQLGIGVATPGLATAEEMEKRKRSRGGVVEGVEMVGVPGPDDSTISGVMAELGRRWMELERTAGTPAAAEVAAQVKAQAALVAGKMPQVQGGNAVEFDQLAGLLVQKAEGLEGRASDRAGTLSSMESVQNDVCLRCHAMYRLGIAESVQSWPDFSPKTDLKPAAPAAASSTRGRRPFTAGQK